MAKSNKDAFFVCDHPFHGAHSGILSKLGENNNGFREKECQKPFFSNIIAQKKWVHAIPGASFSVGHNNPVFKFSLIFCDLSISCHWNIYSCIMISNVKKSKWALVKMWTSFQLGMINNNQILPGISLAYNIYLVYTHCSKASIIDTLLHSEHVLVEFYGQMRRLKCICIKNDTNWKIVTFLCQKSSWLCYGGGVALVM